MAENSVKECSHLLMMYLDAADHHGFIRALPEPFHTSERASTSTRAIHEANLVPGSVPDQWKRSCGERRQDQFANFPFFDGNATVRVDHFGQEMVFTQMQS
jgi:hypothetical protein